MGGHPAALPKWGGGGVITLEIDQDINLAVLPSGGGGVIMLGIDLDINLYLHWN